MDATTRSIPTPKTAGEKAGRSTAEPSLESVERVAQHLKVLADSTRLRLLCELRRGDICVGDLAGQVGGSQANVSKHLGILRSAGLVTCQRNGMNVCYSLADASVFEICRMVLASLAEQAEREAETLRAGWGDT